MQQNSCILDMGSVMGRVHCDHVLRTLCFMQAKTLDLCLQRRERSQVRLYLPNAKVSVVQANGVQRMQSAAASHLP